MSHDPLPGKPHGALRLRYTALSDVGRVRKDNQDSGYAGPHFLAVADGVGGSARGDVASSAAIGELRTLDVPPGNDLQAALAAGIDAAHKQIAALVEQHPELDGTSTTVTAAIFDGTRIGVGHVGDSRGYLLRDGELTQITKDHTFVQSLIDEGRITEEESRVHPHRNLILRAVDGVHETEPDLFLVDLYPGDRILLCSDGASGVLDDAALTALLVQGTVEKAAVDVVRDSLEAGSTDNVTVVVADVVDTLDEDPDETQAVHIGPIVVGAAVEKRKGLSGRRRGRRVDTGELDPVPLPVAGAIENDADPEAIRYAPRPPRRFAWLRRLAVVAVVAVLVWLGGSSAYAWSQKQYYVGPSGQHVVIYRGVEAEVPVLTLHKVYEKSDILLTALPSYNRGQVRSGMNARDLTAARAIIKRLQRAADCSSTATTTPPPAATLTPLPTPTPAATPAPGVTPPAPASPAATPTTAPTTPATPTNCDTP